MRVVLHELVVPLDLWFSARDVQGDERVGIEIFAHSSLADEVRTGISGRHEQGIRGLVNRHAAPYGTAAMLPGVAGPGIMSWLPGTWNGLPIPQALAVLGTESADQADIAGIAAARADDDLVLVDIRCH